MSRYSAKQYAIALFESLSDFAKASPDKSEKVIHNFAQILVKNYDKAQLPKIAMQLKKLERAKLGRHDVVLTSAKPLEKSVIAEVKKKVGDSSSITEVVDPAVLGGLKVLINDELVIDGTMRGRINRTVQHLLKVAE